MHRVSDTFYAIEGKAFFQENTVGQRRNARMAAAAGAAMRRR
jgi:hypothetical protein